MTQDYCGCGCDSNDDTRWGQPFCLAEKVQYADDSIVSSTIFDNDAGSLTVFAFDRGQKLSTHSAHFHAIVHVLDGRAKITVAGQPHTVAAGEMVIMPADVPHSVEAVERFKMILTLFRP